MRELYFGSRLPPIPELGPTVPVVICSRCLGADDPGWIGKKASFPRHVSTNHPGEIVEPFEVKGQKVGGTWMTNPSSGLPNTVLELHPSQ
jgi:hypothetical protein